MNASLTESDNREHTLIGKDQQDEESFNIGNLSDDNEEIMGIEDIQIINFIIPSLNKE
jgi:hypothetical protein